MHFLIRFIIIGANVCKILIKNIMLSHCTIYFKLFSLSEKSLQFKCLCLSHSRKEGWCFKPCRAAVLLSHEKCRVCKVKSHSFYIHFHVFYHVFLLSSFFFESIMILILNDHLVPFLWFFFIHPFTLYPFMSLTVLLFDRL